MIYLEFFAFYFIEKSFLCKFSIRKLNYYSSRVIYWWTHLKACFCIICWNTSSNLIWYCDNFLLKILVRNTVDNSSNFNVVPPYCSNELWSFFSDITLLSKSLTFFLRHWFLTWKFLTTSFKFSISLFKPSNLEINFFCKLKIRLAVSDISEDSVVSKLL